MQSFINNSTLEVKISYIILVIIIIMYFFIKKNKRGYIFSIFNISTLFMGIFTYFIIGLYQYNNEAWYSLNHYSADLFFIYLNKCMNINLIGFLFFMIFTIFIEFNDNKKNIITKNIEFISKNINSVPILLINIIILTLWYTIVLSTIGTMPVFGNRMFASKMGFQTLYNILNGAINLFAIYYSIKFICKKENIYLILMILNLLTLFFVGNRNILLFTILNAYIFYLYKQNKNISKINRKIFTSVLVILVIGIGLDFLRRMNTDIEFGDIFNDILYGNTFCDIRDGAYVLYGIDKGNYGFLLGKTYLADILGFLPTELMPYRDIWSYGNFTTKTLFGWQHHPGLRGGWFLTSYINFGYLGVIISSYIFSYFYSSLENFFYNVFVREKKFDNCGSKVIICDIVQKISLGIMITSGISQTYARMGIVFIIFMMSVILNKKIYFQTSN